jgi:hypothetical protein
VEADADLDQAETTSGCTPLYVSARGGHVEVARALMEAGADLNQALKSIKGSTLSLRYQLEGHTDKVMVEF